MGKLPKWAQNAIREQRKVYIGPVGQMLEDLGVLPPSAEAYINRSYTECYGHEELTVQWQRDMNEEEYVAEKEARAKRQKYRAKEREEIRQARYRIMERSAEEFGVDIVVREETDDG